MKWIYLLLGAVCLLLAANRHSAHADLPKRWEYNIQMANRGIAFGPVYEQDWSTIEYKNMTVMAMINDMGQHGWELVSVSPISTMISANGDRAGSTSELYFTFKRPK